MEAITNTELAILGLAAEQPRYGYQVEQEIAGRGMREWTEIGFSSIYYVLNKLEAAGWLASEVSAGDSSEARTEAGSAGPRRAGPARKVYRLTETGRSGLREAVRERLSNPRPRTGDFDLALANLPVLSPEAARAALETCQAGLRERLDSVRAKWSRDGDRVGAEQSNRPLPAHVDALFDHSVRMMQAELDWVSTFLELQD